MRAIYTILIFLFAGLSAIAQPYKSMFGVDSTRWRMYMTETMPWVTDYLIAKDTIIGTFTYKKVVPTIGQQSFIYFFREDLAQGKVWFKQGCDTADQIFMDYSLQKGDTFKRSNFIPTDTAWIVDTTFYTSGRKHVRLKFFDGAINEHYEYQEGIGWNIGFSGVGTCVSPTSDRLVLCVYQNGLPVYSNKYFSGNCDPVYVKEVQQTDISIHPNPVGEYLSVSIETPLSQAITLTVLDVIGRVQLKELILPGNANKQLQVSNLRPGMYYLVFPYNNQVKSIRFTKQ